MNTHTQRSLPKVIQTLPYVPSESQRGYSLANEAKTDPIAEHKHAVSHMRPSRLVLMLSFKFWFHRIYRIPSRTKQSIGMKCHAGLQFPPPKKRKLVKKSRKSNKKE